MTRTWDDVSEEEDSLADRTAHLELMRWGARPGRIFWRTLHDNLTGVLVWGSCYGLLIFIVTLIFPYQAETGTLVSILDGLGILERLAGSRGIDIAALATFEGYLALESIGWAPTILAAYTIPQAINATLGEERNGTLDLLLTTPIPRWRFFLEKTLAIMASVLAILGIMLMFLIGATQLLDGVELEIWQAVNSIWHIIPITTVILAVALLASVTVRNSGTAGGLAAGFVLISYFIRGISDATGAPFFEPFRYISVYNYYASVSALLEGVVLWRDLLILVVGICIIGLAMVQFQRRDLGI